MKQEFVHLTFKTDRKTSFYLSEIAHIQEKTQPELINEICKNYVDFILSEVMKEAEKEKATT